jgi:hypothetical protein
MPSARHRGGGSGVAGGGHQRVPRSPYRLSLSDVRGVYIDFVLRSNIAQRGRTFREVLVGGEPLVIEGDIISRDRRKLPMQFTISPLRDGDDATMGLVIVLDDLSTVTTASGLGGDQDMSESIIGQSPKMREVFDLIPLMAHTEASVLITGETGTGKDKIAEAIHKRSSGPPNRLSKSTAAPCPNPCSNPSCSATSRGPSPARSRTTGYVSPGPGGDPVSHRDRRHATAAAGQAAFGAR